MRVVVIGLGVQGRKRKAFAGDDFVGAIDPFNRDAEYQNIKEVPLDIYDAACLCTPDDEKLEILYYLLSNKKHVLVEKPLTIFDASQAIDLSSLANSKQVVCYTAYNHRFEPHIIKIRDIIQTNILGSLYSCKIFYGNGTAKLVRESCWRDQGSGVLNDLGSHLLDMINYWFNMQPINFEMIFSNNFENVAPDHVIFANKKSEPKFFLEASLLSWRNTFTCDIFGKLGSVHVNGLCKWGPSVLIHRKRVLPSGIPLEFSESIVMPDPTWEQEYKHFKNLIKNGNYSCELTKDLWIHNTLAIVGK